MRVQSLPGLRRRAAAILAIGAAALLGACAPTTQTAPQPSAHIAADEPAPAAQPMFLDPPFARVPTEGKAIFVNIPSYELVAFQDGEEVLRSPVIVGSARHQTPKLTTATSVVTFRPTWTPTPEMIREEGMSPETRAPGRGNPLGLLAIRLEQGNLIYLHDTNNRGLFEREMRALSHGCMRVEKWDEVAAFVLGIPVDEVHAHANGNRTFNMETEHVPVIVRYETRFPDRFGAVRQHDDVYGRDTAYAEALQATPSSEFAWDALPAGWGAN